MPVSCSAALFALWSYWTVKEPCPCSLCYLVALGRQEVRFVSCSVMPLFPISHALHARVQNGVSISYHLVYTWRLW